MEFPAGCDLVVRTPVVFEYGSYSVMERAYVEFVTVIATGTVDRVER